MVLEVYFALWAGVEVVISVLNINDLNVNKGSHGGADIVTQYLVSDIPQDD